MVKKIRRAQQRLRATRSNTHHAMCLDLVETPMIMPRYRASNRNIMAMSRQNAFFVAYSIRVGRVIKAFR